MDLNNVMSTLSTLFMICKVSVPLICGGLRDVFHEGPRHLNNMCDNVHVSVFDKELMNVNVQESLEF
jgi:hypothetical protein